MKSTKSPVVITFTTLAETTPKAPPAMSFSFTSLAR